MDDGGYICSATLSDRLLCSFKLGSYIILRITQPGVTIICEPPHSTTKRCLDVGKEGRGRGTKVIGQGRRVAQVGNAYRQACLSDGSEEGVWNILTMSGELHFVV